MGIPKALIRDPDGLAWAVRATRLLVAAGCSPVVVVTGASAEQVASELANEPAELVKALDWEEGMGASLRAGLTKLQNDTSAVAALVVPVDVPGLTLDVVRRVAAGVDRSALVRAMYDGKPGHPVLLGREHWDGVIATAVGDQGARAYLEQHPPVEVECGDLADGRDVDRAEDLPEGHRIG
jgi:nicotine blue oxidoreductase